mgnify:CR=1 FL=1
MSWRALGHEPLLAFAVLGLGLFGLHAAVRPDARPELVVDAARLDAARSGLVARLGRPPTPGELATTLQAALDEDRLYHEALRLGLDRDDPIVRRRLIQKLRLVHESLADPGPDDDAALLALRDADPARYAAPPRLAITQVLAARDRHADPAAAARDLADRLAAGADPAALGDPSPHARALGLRPLADLAALFGPDFAAALTDMPEGTWSVVASPLGAHAVRVDARAPAELPPLAVLRGRLRADLAEARRTAAAEAALADLRRRAPAVLRDVPPDLAAALAEPTP